MTAVTLTKISDFLRDAQVRVGVLTTLMIGLRDSGSTEYDDAYNQREALIRFMELLYDQYAAIMKDDGTTFLQASLSVNGIDPTKYPVWTEREIVDEIDYLRYYGQLSYYPFFVFVGFYPQVIGEIASSGFVPGTGWTPPIGVFLQTLRYDAGGNLIAVDWPAYSGMRSLDINTYFSGRP